MKKLGSLFVVAAVMATTVVAAAQTPASGATCDVVPVLRDITVNQGVGSYERLAQGKDTLVRLFLSLPSCAASDATISIRPAATTLTASDTGRQLAAVAPVSPAAATPIEAWKTVPSPDHAGHPKFVVQGRSLTHPLGQGFTAGFTASLAYTAKANKNAPAVDGLLAIAKAPNGSVITKTVERTVNPMRVLVVAMGDASKDYGTQLTADGIKALENGMIALGRTLPVAEGVGPLAGASTAGVRFTLTPTIFDIGNSGLRLMQNGRFCGTAENFDAMKGPLATFLTEWNVANPTAPADRVVGIADEAIAGGGDNGCADGYATVKGSVGWVRAVYDRAGVPSTTGALLAMELGHTLGLVPTNRDGFASTYHSPNVAADGTAVDRAYNLTTRGFLESDRTVMRITAGWDNVTTVFEPVDWSFASCAVGGTVTTECVQHASHDVTAGAEPEPVFVMAGTISHNAAGHVAVVDESHSGTGRPTPPGEDPHVTFVQTTPTRTLTHNVPVRYGETAHTHETDTGGEGHDAHTGSGSFRIAVPLDPTSTKVELRAGTQVLFTEHKTVAPQVVSAKATETIVDAQNVSASPADDDQHASLSPGGELLAWSVGGNVIVASVDDPAKRLTVANATQPALGGRYNDTSAVHPLAFVRDGDVFVMDVDFGPSTPTGDTPVEAYDASPAPGIKLSASHPAWAQDNSRLAFAVNGDILMLDLVALVGQLPCDSAGIRLCRASPVATTPAIEQWPTWSQAVAEPDRLVYTAGNDIVRREVRLGNNPLDPSQAQRVVEAAQEPAMGRATVAFRYRDPLRAGIWTLDTTDPAAQAKQVTSGPSDARPALAGATGGELAFDRPAVAGAPRDVFLGRRRVVIDVTGTDPDGDLQGLKATILVSCGADRRPIAVSLEPYKVEGQLAHFRYEWDPIFGCAAGDLEVLMSDGFSQSLPKSAGRVGGGTAPTPAIASPLPGTLSRLGDVVAASGTAVDAEDRTVADSGLRWELTRSGSVVQQWTGPRRDLVGLAPGFYTLKLSATDSSNRTAVTSSTFRVLDEWVALRRGTADFDPDTLNLPSNGLPVTITINVAGLAAIDPASVRLMEIDGIDVSSNDRFKQIAWSRSGDTAVAKFDRQALEAFIASPDHHSMIGRRIDITVGGRTPSGSADPWRFTAGDSTFVSRSH